jgi:hypothetical protein
VADADEALRDDMHEDPAMNSAASRFITFQRSPSA